MTRISEATPVSLQAGDLIPVARPGDNRALAADVDAAIDAAIDVITPASIGAATSAQGALADSAMQPAGVNAAIATALIGNLVYSQSNPDSSRFIRADGSFFDPSLWPDIGQPIGTQMTSRTLPVSANWNAFATNGIIICMIANGSNISLVSSDGINWNQGTLPSATTWNGLTWDGTRFIAVSGNTAGAVSADGINWSSITLPENGNDILWNGSYLCFVSVNKTYTSPDAITWTPGVAAAGWGSVKIAWNGTVFCGVATGSPDTYTSTDGLNWTRNVAALGTGTLFANVTVSDTGVFCTAAQSNILFRSTDGITWSQVITSIGNFVNVTFGNGVFYAVSSLNNAVAVSKDYGITWYIRFTLSSNAWTKIFYCLGLCLVIRGSNTTYNTTPDIGWPKTPNVSLSTANSFGWQSYIRAKK